MAENSILLSADEAAAELCRRRLSHFVKEFWDEVVPNKLIWSKHMDVICDEIQAIDERVFKSLKKKNDLIINVPPGTSKTKIASVMSTAWEFARMPEIKVFVGSYSDAAVSGISDEIRLIMRSEKYRTYFPNVEIRKDKNTVHNFKTTKNGEFYAFTVGGTLTSKHANILKIDDPLNPKQAASKTELENSNNFFDKTLPTRKVDKEVTPTILIMQRLATNDPTGHLLEKKGKSIRHVKLPGTISDKVRPIEYKKIYTNGLLDPKRLSQSALNELKIDLGSAGYAGQIDQEPVPDGGLIWKKEWFVIVPDEVFPDKSLMTHYGTDWDLAYTSDETNSASAYVTAGRIGHRRYIDDIGFRWLEFPELIKWMKTKPSPHYIEAKASGKSAKQSLTKKGIIAIEQKVKGGSDKVARANMATPLAESGVVYIRQSIADKLFNDTNQGILFFPKGAHNDLNDAFTQSLQRLNNTGGIHVADDGLGDKFDDDLDWIEEDL